MINRLRKAGVGGYCSHSRVSTGVRTFKYQENQANVTQLHGHLLSMDVEYLATGHAPCVADQDLADEAGVDGGVEDRVGGVEDDEECLGKVDMCPLPIYLKVIWCPPFSSLGWFGEGECPSGMLAKPT